MAEQILNRLGSADASAEIGQTGSRLLDGLRGPQLEHFLNISSAPSKPCSVVVGTALGGRGDVMGSGQLKIFVWRLLVPVSVGALAVGLLTVSPAGAARSQTVRCMGTADYCGATVSIGGGVTSRVVNVMLTGTNLKLVGAYAVPGTARRGFTISNASYRLGGSQYRFTLNSLRSNPRRARLVLLFAPDGAPGKSGVGGRKPLRDWRPATAIFNVGAGMTVSIVGGGGGTSNCTTDETNTTFTTTKAEDESHGFGFNSKGSGSCWKETSWSYFRFTVKDPAGRQVGSGALIMSQNNPLASYYVDCRANIQQWQGINCSGVGDVYNRTVLIERIY